MARTMRFGGVSGWAYAARHWKFTLFAAVFVGIPVLIFRVVSGRNIVGGGRDTDAAFCRSARNVRGSWWGDLPGAARAGIRLLVVGCLVLWFTRPTLVVLIGVALAGVVGWQLWARHRERQHERRVLRPVWPAVAGIIGVDTEEPPSKWLDIPPRDKRALSPSEGDPIVVGLRAADPEDDKRVAALVTLFDQRFGLRHAGRVDYASRLVFIRPRPVEPAVWPAVASAVGVARAELSEQWLRMPEDPTQSGASLVVRMPEDVIDETDVVSDLRTLMHQRYGGAWTTTAKWAAWPASEPPEYARQVVLMRKQPEPTPPTTVDFLAEHPEYQEIN